MRQDSGPGRTWLRGAFAGFVATVPMTIFMLTTQRYLPRGQRYELPPEIITKELAQKAHVRHRMNKAQVQGASLVSHFGYGAAMGALYSATEGKLSWSALLKGIVFGLVVWSSSYLVLLPLLGMAERGQREPGRRNLLMIGAHIVWGATLGVVGGMLKTKGEGSDVIA